MSFNEFLGDVVNENRRLINIRGAVLDQSLNESAFHEPSDEFVTDLATKMWDVVGSLDEATDQQFVDFFKNMEISTVAFDSVFSKYQQYQK